jgi:hypothetical protein
MTLAIIFVDIFIACMKKSHLLQDIDELTADCDDVDYFSAVPLSSRKSWLAGELKRNNYGITTMGEKTMEKLRTYDSAMYLIKNSPNYEILYNLEY